MNEASPKSNQKMFKGSLAVIGSRGSPAGNESCNSPDGQQTDLFGVRVCHAKVFHAPAKDKVLATIEATSGFRFYGSSASAALSQSLVSRLKQRLGTAGSIEYSQTWKRRVTPAGRVFWEHTARAPHTSGNDFSGWPTVTIADTGCSETKREGGENLGVEAMKAGWPTCAARDWRDGRAGQETMDKNARPLNETVTQLVDAEATKVSGLTPSGSPAETENPAASLALSAAFSGWLQGFPKEWTLAGLKAVSHSARNSKAAPHS